MKNKKKQKKAKVIKNKVSDKVILEVRNLTKKYRTAEEVLTLFDKVNFSVKSRDYVGIIGSSGSGKSTLLNCICGLEEYDSGLIYINGKNFTELTTNEKNKIRSSEIGFVFRENNLVEFLTVRENLELPLQINGIGGLDIKTRVDDIIKEFELEKIKNTQCSKLFPYDTQIISLARAVITKPKLLIMDEPTGELSSNERKGFFDLVNYVNSEFNIGTIVFSHDSKVAMMVNKVLRLEDGKLN